MKALDTSVLARFFIGDPDDRQAARQRPAAIAALSERAFVSVTAGEPQGLPPSIADWADGQQACRSRKRSNS